MSRTAGPDAERLTLTGVKDWLAANASEAERQKLLGYGIPNDRALGVSMGQMLALARKRPKDPELAAALWADGGYEMRTLALLLDDPGTLTRARMDAMVAGFDNWAICDTACFRLFDKAPRAWDAVPQWAASERLYTRRAAFALVWGLSVHDKQAGDQRFLEALTLAEAHASDARPHVAKAISMAVRATGKRNTTLRAAALNWADCVEPRGKTEARLAREVRRALG
ncbi:DNA alkylation repair protein [Roseinatronobacter alkalisoli]|uniref:DNA alkylation repair protein n=1 Tax=Roseinatronobacter alkalisoli TaxID=3028235 RepID=A0ABT5T689_9RHOB|nr:DNA alkylation repair protein [Roseinatronobacter sp. HJB301]MDD7970632.1 DNA alkylation repair protein [Roseinatronobacter sp. HJB301]